MRLLNTDIEGAILVSAGNSFHDLTARQHDTAVSLSFEIGWNGFGSSFMGWAGIGTENLTREDL